MIGLYGKMPSHGDFVRRNLPESFIQPWDAWLQEGIVAARAALEADYAAVWAAAPAWRFRLPSGACGPMAALGVLIPSRDATSRLFPLTLATVLPSDMEAPSEAWYAALENAARDGRDQGKTADTLLADLEPSTREAFSANSEIPAVGWWTRDQFRWDLASLPDASGFLRLLQERA